MTITLREKILIGSAILLILVAVVISTTPGWESSISKLLPDRNGAASRLAKAQALIRSSGSINRRYQEARQAEQALILTPLAKELPATAVEQLMQIGAGAGVKLNEVKPGQMKQDGSFDLLPVQIRIQAPLIQVMDYLTTVRERLPMVRITRINLSAVGDGTVEAILLVEFLNRNGGKTTARTAKTRKAPSRLSGADQSKFAGLMKDRIQHGPPPVTGDWSRLAAAFDSVIGTNRPESDYAVDRPRLLGIVSFQGKTQALIGLGNDSWYFSAGERKAGIEVLAVNANQVTLTFGGKMIKLVPADRFSVSPLQ